MVNIKVTLVCSLVCFQVMVIPLCETLVDMRFKQLHHGYRWRTSAVELPVMSRVRCCDRCMSCPNCQYVNYNNSTNTCGLVVGGASMNFLTPDTGWSVYRAVEAFPCPVSTNDFTDVGTVRIAVCTNKLTQPEARRACEGFGRLVHLDTDAKFDAVTNFMRSQWYADHLWIDGQYDFPSSTWRYIDGQPMPVDRPYVVLDRSDIYAVDVPFCIRLWPSKYISMNDRPCFTEYGYVCEMV